MAEAHSTPSGIGDLPDLDDQLTHLIEISESIQLVLNLETQVPADMIYSFIMVLRLLNEAMCNRLQKCHDHFIH